MERNFSNLYRSFKLFLVAFPFFCALITSLGLLLSTSVSIWYFLFSLVASFAVSFTTLRDTVISSISATFLIVLLILISSFYLDFTWDARRYHHPAEIALADGWNPVHEYNIKKWNVGWKNQGGIFKHILYFPKGQWYVGAVVLKLFKNIESTNFTRLLYIILSILIVSESLLYFERLGPWQRWFLALLAGINPVSLSQWQCGYVDGLVGSLISIVLFSSIGYMLTGRKIFLVYIFFTWPILANVKYTGFFYGCVISFGFLVLGYFLFKKRLRIYLKYGVATGIATVLIGINPYVTNTIHYGEPFYRVLHVKKLFHQTKQVDTPRNSPIVWDWSKYATFYRQNRLSSFLISHILADPGQADHITYFKNPFQYNRVGVENRVGAFGPLFKIPLAMSLVLIFLFIRTPFHLGVILTLLCSIFINPMCWWARYTPQIWLLPLCVILFLWDGDKTSGWRKPVCSVMAFAMLFNSLIIFGNRIAQDWNQTVDTYINMLNNDPRQATLFYDSKRDRWAKAFLLVERRRLKDLFDARLVDLAALPPREAHSYPLTYVYGDELRVYAKREVLTFLQYLERFSQDGYIFISVKGNAAYEKMGDSVKDYLRKAGAQMEGLRARASYVAVLKAGKVILESGDDIRAVELDFKTDYLNAHLESAGFPRSRSRITINDSEYSLKKRGFNCVAYYDGKFYKGNFDASSNTNPLSPVTVSGIYGIIDFVKLSFGKMVKSDSFQ